MENAKMKPQRNVSEAARHSQFARGTVGKAARRRADLVEKIIGARFKTASGLTFRCDEVLSGHSGSEHIVLRDTGKGLVAKLRAFGDNEAVDREIRLAKCISQDSSEVDYLPWGDGVEVPGTDLALDGFVHKFVEGVSLGKAGAVDAEDAETVRSECVRLLRDLVFRRGLTPECFLYAPTHVDDAATDKRFHIHFMRFLDNLIWCPSSERLAICSAGGLREMPRPPPRSNAKILVIAAALRKHILKSRF